jgi:hypothetical protein
VEVEDGIPISSFVYILINRVTVSIVGISKESQLMDSWLPVVVQERKKKVIFLEDRKFPRSYFATPTTVHFGDGV